ncbi:CHAT domain-containing protein [Cytophaga aurantiaca]|uniref:CHAT domain-containing protein n=1 Tax=Cytophaga aurantiaca TaxID=29530 RepID=UPI00035FED13|nr:CHAT domain-containing protein [Cytophaga aurantiaca]
MLKKIVLVVAICVVGLLAKASSPIYEFDYNQSIIDVYKPRVVDMGARYEYRQYISKLQTDIDNNARTYTRIARTTENYKKIFESILKSLAFVDANYDFKFTDQSEFGTPFSSMTYIHQLYKYKIPTHVIYEILLYRFAYYTNTHHPTDYSIDSSHYASLIKPTFDRFTSCVYELKDEHPFLVKRLYEYQLYFKNLTLISDIEVKTVIKKYMLTNKNKDLEKIYTLWLSNGDSYAQEQLYYVASTKQPLNTFPVDEGAVYGNGYLLNFYKITSEQCQDAMPVGNLSVDILKFNYYSTDSLAHSFSNLLHYSTAIDQHYAALILSKDSIYFETLPSASVLEKKQYSFYRNAIKFQQTDTLSYHVYWSSIDKVLLENKCTNVMVCPDGIYNIINLNTLERTPKHYVVDKYNISRVINSKALLHPLAVTKVKTNKQPVILMGYPNYNLGQDQFVDSATVKSSLTRDIELSFNGGTIPLLPATKEEIETTSGILKKYKKHVYLYDDSKENQLYSIQSPYLLHIATHGFFLPDDKTDSIDNPLSRCGLLLAGSTKTLQQGIRYTDSLQADGILLASEIIYLSLYNTKLVVLSACETGLGQIQDGEGVYGFQRALGIAGAEYIVMSLWKVDDAATKDFMIMFYSNLIATQFNVESAFEQTQKTMMQKYPLPFYWGAFILVRN